MKILLSLLLSQALMAVDASGVYKFPFKDTWFVSQGGDTINVNHHMSEISQWFAMDFIRVVDRNPFRNKSGKDLEDYYGWNSDVYSPVQGDVIAVENDKPDQLIGQTDTSNPFGNFVCIKVNEREYCYLAHFKIGSITTKVGERVDIGSFIGKCGNSGNTTNPHVHMHVQDTPTPFKGQGLRVRFTKVTIQMVGDLHEDVSWPVLAGQFVRN